MKATLIKDSIYNNKNIIMKKALAGTSFFTVLSAGALVSHGIIYNLILPYESFFEADFAGTSALFLITGSFVAAKKVSDNVKKEFSRYMKLALSLKRDKIEKQTLETKQIDFNIKEDILKNEEIPMPNVMMMPPVYDTLDTAKESLEASKKLSLNNGIYKYNSQSNF